MGFIKHSKLPTTMSNSVGQLNGGYRGDGLINYFGLFDCYFFEEVLF